MRFCVWDTETTGFPTKGGDLIKQPYIIQFAAIEGEYQDDNYQEIARHNILIRPPISIPFSASQVHGIFDKDVADCLSIESHIEDILQILHRADIVIGHNIEFDEEILSYELERLGRKGEYSPQKSICTMQSTVDYCKLQGRGFAYKPPKLSELYKYLFGEFFEGAHNAIIDVEATTRCFLELLRRKVIVPEQSNLMRLF